MTLFDQLVPAPTGRFDGITRGYGPAEVEALRGSVVVEQTLARRGANRLWEMLKRDEPTREIGRASCRERV